MPTVTIPSIYGYGGFTAYAAVPFYGWVIGHPLEVDADTPTGLNPHGYSCSIDLATGIVTVSYDESDPDFIGIYGGRQVWFPGAVDFSVQVGSLPALEVTATATRNESFGVSLELYATTGGGAGLIRNGWNFDNPIVEYNYIGHPADAACVFLIDWGDGTIETIGPTTETWTPSIPLKTLPNQPTGPDNPEFTVDVNYVAQLTRFHQFAGPSSSTGIVVTAIPGQSYLARITEPNIKPKAAFTIIESEDEDYTIALDASASYDIDGTIVSYNWSYGGAGTQSGSLPITPDYTYNAQGTYTVSLIVTDNRGATDDEAQAVTVEAAKTLIGLADMPGNVFYSAVNSDNDVQIYHIPDGI